MIKDVKKLKAAGYITAILSDQTNWLDEIDTKTPFFYNFDYIFNSFKLNKGKRDPTVFRDVCDAMELRPEEVIFIDDNLDNIERAQGEGLQVIHFSDIENFIKNIKQHI